MSDTSPLTSSVLQALQALQALHALRASLRGPALAAADPHVVTARALWSGVIGAARVRSAGGRSVARLSAIERVYDPDNAFGVNGHIPPTSVVS